MKVAFTKVFYEKDFNVSYVSMRFLRKTSSESQVFNGVIGF